MELLLVIGAVIWLWQNAKVEITHALAGTTSPRWRAKLERQRQQGLPGHQPRYASRAFLADLWGDMLQAKTEARRARTAEREPVAAAGRMAAHVDDALAVAAERPSPGHREGELAYPDRLPPTEPLPVQEPDDPPTARIIPMFPQDQPKEPIVADNNTPTTGSGEVTGLDPAIAHAQAVAAAHRAHAGNETFLNGLAAAGHGPATLAQAGAARIKSQEAQAEWERLAQMMTDTNKPVQQAYVLSPDAADKGHLLGGR